MDDMLTVKYRHNVPHINFDILFFVRLLVAAYVGQTAEGGRLKLRQTTLLPNVPGLPMMMAALFCPTMEPKVSGKVF